MINECIGTKYEVKGTWSNSTSTLDWPVDTLGEAKAFIDGFTLADPSKIKDFKIVEIREVVAVISIHTKYKRDVGTAPQPIVGFLRSCDRDVCSHTSEEEAVKHLEYLKSEDGLFNDDLDDYDWHHVTIKTEHEVSDD